MEESHDLAEEEPAKFYPGSAKGPSPYDDPDHFADWYIANVTAETRELIQLEAPESVRDSKFDTDRIETGHQHIVTSEMSHEEVGIDMPEDTITQTDTEFNFISNYSETDVAIIPDTLTEDPQGDPDLIERWAIFRMYPKAIELMTNYNQIIQQAIQTAEAPRVIPTLWRYYKLLPKEMREHPAVKMVFKGMEFGCHRQSLREKELMLNYVAQLTLPMDPVYAEALMEARISQKHFVQGWEEKQILEEVEVDEDEEETAEKKKKKKNIVPVSDPASFRQPVKREDDIEEAGVWQEPIRKMDSSPVDKTPILPIDFYDNEDGFWDNYLTWKERQYNQLPTLPPRRHLKH